MKKLLLSSFALASIAVFAYTQTDVDNATYLADKGIITTQSTTAGYRLDDTITRAEVAGIALKLRGTTLPEGYTCKRYFGDTIRNDWICRAAELAADAGFVSRTNTKFRPGDKITRAEAFSIIYKASGNTLDIPEKMTVGNVAIDKDIAYWQQVLFFKVTSIDKIEIPGIKFVQEIHEDSPANGSNEYYFYPNRVATRAEVFGFAKNILEYKTTMSGEVNLYLQNLINAKKNNINTVDTNSRIDE